MVSHERAAPVYDHLTFYLHINCQILAAMMMATAALAVAVMAASATAAVVLAEAGMTTAAMAALVW